MRGYLFDAMVHVVIPDHVPEKWLRHWKEVTVGNKHLIIFELLVAEIMYQLSRRNGESAAKKEIMWLKGLNNTHEIKPDNNIAMDAGKLRLTFQKYQISYVDAFSLVIAKRDRSEIFTTDSNVRDVGKIIGVTVNFLPKEALIK